MNPFRYRGYIFDEETGLYYLRSRYYNPNLCRFINADDVEALGADGDINGYQLFIYCMNDPVNNRDEAGSWSLPNWAKVAIGAALIVGAAVVATVATGGVACFAAGAAMAKMLLLMKLAWNNWIPLCRFSTLKLKTSIPILLAAMVFLYIISAQKHDANVYEKLGRKKKLLYRMVLQNITGRQNSVPS